MGTRRIGLSLKLRPDETRFCFSTGVRVHNDSNPLKATRN